MSGALLAAGGAKTKVLTATISAGAFNSGKGTSFGWSNSVTVSGGSGSYSYAWAFTFDTGGNWSFSGQGLVGTNINVTTVFDQADADVQCTVTDNVTGKGATSNSVHYTFLHNSG